MSLSQYSRNSICVEMYCKSYNNVELKGKLITERQLRINDKYQLYASFIF